MITITDKQAQEVSDALDEKFGDHITAEEVRRGMQYLADALNHGLRLNSGDGFYYKLKRKYGNLCCHDGSQLKGSLWTQISQYVWQGGRALEAVYELSGLDIPTELEDGFDDTATLDHVMDSLFTAGVSCD